MPQTLQIAAAGVRQQRLLSWAFVDRYATQDLASARMEDGSEASTHVPMSRSPLRAARASARICWASGGAESRVARSARALLLRSERDGTITYDGQDTKLADAGGGHVGFGHVVGTSRRGSGRRKNGTKVQGGYDTKLQVRYRK